MRIEIGQYEYTECWDGVLYKKLSAYPNISDWEIQNILDFIQYESFNGRNSVINAEEGVIRAIEAYKEKYQSGNRLLPPDTITECTACPKYKGCMTDLVCHTSSLKDAISILDCGKLLSAVLARKKSAKELMAENRNAANDPEDYFDYVMFAWGNCQAGDRLVMERKLGRFPNEDDLSKDFKPGVRFFFKYENIVKHPDAVFDGVLPVKIKNGVVLQDWVQMIVVPAEYRSEIEPHIPAVLSGKIRFVERNGADIWKWSEIVYEYAKATNVYASKE